MLSFSEDQATALVTDPGTLTRGRALAGPAKWGGLGRTDTAAWGECAGSGSKPYLTGIDLTEPAFKCSCPSRVFPCKHGAGLLLLLARQPALLPPGTPPAWLADWLDKRQTKGAEQAEKAAARPAKTTTESADAGGTTSVATANAGRQKRETQREARMQAGAEELETWLLDLVRAGLADLGQKPGNFWEVPAGRLVDNQLPGLAATLRELADYPTAGPDWAGRLLGRLGEVYVLLRTFLNRNTLAPTARQDVEQQVGSTPKKDELLADPATLVVADTWLVLGQYAWAEERLTGRRSWLYGQQSGRLALVLDFAFGNQAFGTPLIPQGTYAGELAFYPGLLPLRAIAVGLALGGSAAAAAPPGLTISHLLNSYATALAHQPWLRQWPAALAPVQLRPSPDGRWLLHHTTEPLTLPLRLADEELAWHWLALSGGQPLTLFGEWDGQAFCPLISWVPDDEETSANPLEVMFFEQETDTREPVGDAATILAHRPPAAPDPAATSEIFSGANAPAWPQLLRLALLGTRQTVETLPTWAALPLPTMREQQLLLAAGALTLVRKAGYRPAAATAPAPLPAPAEPLPALGPRGTECLHQMLTNSQHLDLLPNYLRRVAAAGRRVPTRLLAPLLQHATRSATLTTEVGPVLGARGAWLAALNPAWARLITAALPATTDPADLSPWETGTLAVRLAWLQNRFTQDADAARALLLAALPTEPAKEQEALLSALADHLHPTAEPALEALLRARGQQVRRRAASLLVKLPGAALTERLWARAASLITARRKLLGLGSVELEITLPTTWDKSWLADGIEEQNDLFVFNSFDPSIRSTVGPAAARLGNLLALLPPHRWAAHLGLTPAELLAAALASEWAVPLLPCWAQSTLLHRDADFATAFLALWQQLPYLHRQVPGQQQHHHLRNISWAGLAYLLSTADRQTLLLAPALERVRRQETDWSDGLQFVPAPWPRVLSLAVTEAIATMLTGTAGLTDTAGLIAGYNLPGHLQEIAWLLVQTVHPRIAPADRVEAARQIEAIAQPHEYFQHSIQTFVATLRFQVELEASLQE
ncbi:DUF5691 domain-containing protein [Hymenobacter sp. H14-R3]|uniref:SWIM zinc finger family protein n=1 Tax=Hymenobacter sp. H14-R3 TaxID=3046308 RepID=UPI0024B8DAC4|nr:DUF5691 domain-containing protein [Hymenobacter sp. H14-R3]MDJ0367254.1 DUF5691 domain-containing protein [Hymenobacter sp. H14-R3]